MAVIATQKYYGVIGDRRLWIGDITLDTSYPTGGYSLSPSLFGMGSVIDNVDVGDAGGKPYEWDGVNNKLKAYSAVGTEVANATSLATVVVRAEVRGR